MSLLPPPCALNRWLHATGLGDAPPCEDAPWVLLAWPLSLTVLAALHNPTIRTRLFQRRP